MRAARDWRVSKRVCLMPLLSTAFMRPWNLCLKSINKYINKPICRCRPDKPSILFLRFARLWRKGCLERVCFSLWKLIKLNHSTDVEPGLVDRPLGYYQVHLPDAGPSGGTADAGSAMVPPQQSRPHRFHQCPLLHAVHLGRGNVHRFCRHGDMISNDFVL